MAMAPDGSWAVSASSDETLKRWFYNSRFEAPSAPSTGAPAAATFGPTGGRVARLVLSDDGQLTLWTSGRVLTVREGKQEYDFLGEHDLWDCGVAQAADGRYAVSAVGAKDPRVWDMTETELRVWDLDKKELLMSLPGPLQRDICGAALSPDGRFAFSMSENSRGSACGHPGDVDHGPQRLTPPVRYALPQRFPSAVRL